MGSTKEIQQQARGSIPPERMTILIPKSWKIILKDYAYQRGVSLNKIICDTLQRKFKLKENKRARGRPAKYRRILIKQKH